MKLPLQSWAGRSPALAMFGVAGLLAAGAPAPAAVGTAGEPPGTSGTRTEPVPPLPPLDAPKRPFPEALLHLTLLEAEHYEDQLDRLESGTYDLGVYNEMYEFFRRESIRLSDAYPDARFIYDTPELSSASSRLTKAREAFQTSRFIAEQLENREKLGLDAPDRAGGSFEGRALALIRDYTAHYREAADRIRRASPEKSEEVAKGIRAEGLRLNRDLRRLSTAFPDRPSIFDGTFVEEPLGPAQRALEDALADYQAARKAEAEGSAAPPAPK
jgi:hypothetical protein